MNGLEMKRLSQTIAQALSHAWPRLTPSDGIEVQIDRLNPNRIMIICVKEEDDNDRENDLARNGQIA